MFPALLGVLLLQSSLAAANGAAVVRHFVDAFNEHDIDAMLAHVADDFLWMSVKGGTITIESRGHDQLRSAMSDYFSSIPSARSDLRSVVESGPFVQAIEQAFWESDGVEKSQCSVSVYEIADGKIVNVWYFPAYQCP